MERAMGIEPTSEVWEAVPRIMRLLRELAQICKAGLERPPATIHLVS